MRGNDGNMYSVKMDKRGIKRWIKNKANKSVRYRSQARCGLLRDPIPSDPSVRAKKIYVASYQYVKENSLSKTNLSSCNPRNTSRSQVAADRVCKDADIC